MKNFVQTSFGMAVNECEIECNGIIFCRLRFTENSFIPNTIAKLYPKELTWEIKEESE